MAFDITALNRSYSIDQQHTRLFFIEDESGIPIIQLENRQASASISLQGAHLLRWKPVTKDDVIWLSEEALFAPGRSIRGGIPVCWPWFGVHHKDDQFPAHGFARTVFWSMKKTEVISADETCLYFELNTQRLDDKYQLMWPQPARLEYKMTIGKTLSLQLTTYNLSQSEMMIGQALHTYFSVDDLKQTVVDGLNQCQYLDKPDNFKQKQQQGNIHFTEEVDRIDLDTMDDVTIVCKNKRIKITKEGSASTIVWNPWKEVAEQMGDLGTDGYLKMLCVESANAANDCQLIPPGGQHSLAVEYVLV